MAKDLLLRKEDKKTKEEESVFAGLTTQILYNEVSRLLFSMGKCKATVFQYVLEKGGVKEGQVGCN